MVTHKYKEFNYKGFKFKVSFFVENPENVEYFLKSFHLEFESNKNIYKLDMSHSNKNK